MPDPNELVMYVAVRADLAAHGVLHEVVVDEGRNHADAGTKTCAGLVPMTRSTARGFVGRLQVL